MNPVVKIENFDYDELRCNCCGDIEYTDEFLIRLQAFRYRLNTVFRRNIPLIILSGYRCDKHNLEVGGVPNSRHTVSDAVDICSTAITPEEIYKDAKDSRLFSTVILYEKSRFVHIDSRSREDVKAWKWNK